MQRAWLALLALVALTAIASWDSVEQVDHPVELLHPINPAPVVNARGQKQNLVLPEDFAAIAAGAPEDEESKASKTILHQQIVESALNAGRACSGTQFNAHACSTWWSEDVTIYDMQPPNGVLRGRAAWEERLRSVSISDPHDEMQIRVESVGWVGKGTEYAWANGYWGKFYKGKIHKRGRYSAIMQEQKGAWQFYIVSDIEMDSEADWTPVTHGLGGPLRHEAQAIMTQFAKGYNSRNYALAFSSYSRRAKFPFMKSIGGSSLAFAVQALDHQKQRLSPAHMYAQVDEAKPLGKSGLIAVAHGIQKMTDDDSKIYTMGKFSFLLILERQTVNDEWKVRYDFSPNNWLLAPTVH